MHVQCASIALMGIMINDEDFALLYKTLQVWQTMEDDDAVNQAMQLLDQAWDVLQKYV